MQELGYCQKVAIGRSKRAILTTAMMMLTSLAVKSKRTRFGYHRLRAMRTAVVAKDDQGTCSTVNHSQLVS